MQNCQNSMSDKISGEIAVRTGTRVFLAFHLPSDIVSMQANL